MKNSITKVYGAEFPSIELATADNSVLAHFINALEETDRDVKQISKMGRAKMMLRIEKKAEALGLDISDGQHVHHIIVMGSFAEWLKVVTAPVDDKAEAKAKKEAEAKAKKEAAAKAKAEKAAEAKAKKEAAAKAKAEKAAQNKGSSIRSVAESILMQVAYKDDDGRAFGLSYDEVLAEVKKQFPEAKTTVACLRWYAVHMRDREVKVPARPRANAVKAETEETKGE